MSALSTRRGSASEAARYWLAHCEGFRVQAPGGRVGLVERVVQRGGPEEPDALIVRGGLFGGRGLVVPVEEVEAVLPRRQRLELRASPEVGGPDFLTEFLRRARAGRGQGSRARLV